MVRMTSAISIYAILGSMLGLEACDSLRAQDNHPNEGSQQGDGARSGLAGSLLSGGGQPSHQGGSALPRGAAAAAPPGCVPKTCEQRGANCGLITDQDCGSLVDCGSCVPGQACGAAGPNRCGPASVSKDGGCSGPACGSSQCVPQACQSQNIECGAAGDGCGSSLNCGDCASPRTCGGGGTPGQCGCTGECARVPSCAPGTKTTLSGKIYDPAGLNPLYHALVYIPNDPNDPMLDSFPPGIACDQCGATAAGSPLVSTLTDPSGYFTLENVPVGKQITLVAQMGRWRRKFHLDILTPCVPNAVADRTLRMPSDHTQGNMPLIAVSTGAVDEVECVLLKMGISRSEFTNPDGGGRVHFYLGTDPANTNDPKATAGAAINDRTPDQSALFQRTGTGVPVINQYDMVVLACEGTPIERSNAELTALREYANGGGRVFATHFNYVWLRQNGDFARTARWNADHQDRNEPEEAGVIDKVSNPKGADFQSWLEETSVSRRGSGMVDLLDLRWDTDGVIPPTQQWISRDVDGQQIPAHFTFNTPVSADSAHQCGRVLFSDFHVAGSDRNSGTLFPEECDTSPMNAQQKLFEFMLFDLASCVEPYTPACTPRTCAAQGIACGPAGDGCGKRIDCGLCADGQACGGGGPGKCGSAIACSPQSCAVQGIGCGPAGDGCGNPIECGSCPAGYICGLHAPGRCDRATIN